MGKLLKNYKLKTIYILALLFLTFMSTVMITVSNAAWVQEDTTISGKTTLENKMNYLREISLGATPISWSRITTNRSDLKDLFNNGDVGVFLKDDFFDVLGNNLLYQDVSSTLYQTYFGYKIVDGVKIISLKSDFLLEIQKNPNGTFKDATRSPAIANSIVAQTQLYLGNFINAELANKSNFPKSYIKNHYSVVVVGSGNTFALNRVFDQVCKKNEAKSICFEGINGEIIAFGLRDSIAQTYTNSQEYEELVSKYTIDGKVQLPSSLQSKLTANCPISATKTVGRFIENGKLNECGLIPQDLNCDTVNEWIDYDKFSKTTTIYAANGAGGVIDVRVILYLNNKQIVKFYSDSTGCFSNILTKDVSENNAYKIISQGFNNGSGPDLTKFTTSDILENGVTLTNGKLTTKTKLNTDTYKFFTTEPVYVDASNKASYKIDVDVKDINTGPTTDKVLGSLQFSTTSSIANRTVAFNLSQSELGIWTPTSNIKVDSASNGITNKTTSHYTLKFENNLFNYYYNGKEMFSYDANNKTVVPKNSTKIASQTGLATLTPAILEMKGYILFSDHNATPNGAFGPSFSKEYSDYYVSKKDASKLYLYKLNTGLNNNYYLGQVIDTTDFSYNLFGKGTSGDDTCKSMVFKNENFFDNNLPLTTFDSTAISYIGFNPSNGCNFRSQKISYYTDSDGKLSYLKKIKVNGTYNKTLGLFEFVQSEDNLLQGIDFGTILDSSLSGCTITQVINNELDSCSLMKPLDIDGDGWSEWVLSKDGEFEVFNNVISQNTLGELIPKMELILKSNGDSYCTTITQEIEYFKYWSGDATKTCKSTAEITAKVAASGGTAQPCMVDSTIVVNSIDNYQLVYGITGLSKETKKYGRSQIISGGEIACD